MKLRSDFRHASTHSTARAIVTVGLLFALVGCQTTEQASTNTVFDRRENHEFIFNKTKWVIVYGKDIILSDYGTWLKRPAQPLQNTDSDYAETVKASAFFMTNIMNCPVGQKPGPMTGGIVGPSQPGVMNVYLKCFDESSFAK